MYLILGCGIPTLIVLITVIVNFSTDGLVLYGVGFCWINHDVSVVVAFLVPLAVFITLSMVLFIFSIVLLCRASLFQAKLGKGSTISYMRVNGAVFSVTGLTWLSGLIAILAGSAWAWYLFFVLNSLHIFKAFLCTKKVLKLYISTLRRKKKTSSGSTIET